MTAALGAAALREAASVTRRPTLRALTGARFVAASAIVVLHLSEVLGVPSGNAAFLGFAVSFFFVRSGFILA